MALELAKENHVTALVRGPRNDRKDKELLAVGINIVYGGIADNQSYAEYISKADYVFHFAALFNINGPKEELY
ncbi:MAG: NmrA family NAD(P)-binding protein [Elusimicrobia bacterium]|nr:NmrA family NAD(P)-binding protein [Elusimicrobiota bacterium]